MTVPTRIMFKTLDKALGHSSRCGGYITVHSEYTEWFSLEYNEYQEILVAEGARPWGSYPEADKWFTQPGA